MSDVFGWFTVALPAVMAIVLVGSALFGRRTSTRAGTGSSGALGAFDEVWSPSAADARAAWEIEQQLPIEAPSPDRGTPEPVIRDGRIIIHPR